MEVDRIDGLLYVGSAPRVFSEPSPFRLPVPARALFLCAEEFQPHPDHFGSQRERGYSIYRKGFADEMMDAIPDVAWGAASIARTHLKRRDPVILTCIQGRNRSALVAALTLHMLLGISGRDARRIVQHMRHASTGPTLSNRSFVALLDALPQRLGR